MGRLQGKIAIVTGSSSGIGRSIAREFAQQGAVVVCADISDVAREEIASESSIKTHDLIVREGGTAEFLRADVTHAEDQEQLIQKTVQKFGRLDM